MAESSTDYLARARVVAQRFIPHLDDDCSANADQEDGEHDVDCEYVDAVDRCAAAIANLVAAAVADARAALLSDAAVEAVCMAAKPFMDVNARAQWWSTRSEDERIMRRKDAQHAIEAALRATEKKTDACEICHGSKGGVPGNENIIDGKVVCDYCHAEMNATEKAGT